MFACCSAAILGNLVIGIAGTVCVGGAVGAVCAESAAHGTEGNKEESLDVHLQSSSQYGCVGSVVGMYGLTVCFFDAVW